MATSIAMNGLNNRAFAASLCVAPGGAGGCYSSIQSAVNAAASGDTVNVTAGAYNENIVIQKAISLLGAGPSTTMINAAPSIAKEGVIIQDVNGGSQTVISGFTIQNSALSGILISNSSNVQVSNNVIQGNDLNLNIPSNPQQSPTCPGAFPFDQDDCGEAIHLRGVSNSKVLNNVVQHNAGGILLTDETGSTFNNQIDGNTVQDNILDCGITLASHPSAILPPSSPGGRPSFQPGHGIYGNQVTNNTVSRNGAAGVGIFASVPGTAAHDNLVQGNTIMDNGIAGVSLHSHAPNQNLDGNQIIGNTIGTNNLFGDGDAGDFETTGILVSAAVVPAAHTKILNNTVFGDSIGIWLSNTVGTVIQGNHISATTPVVHANSPGRNGTGPSATFNISFLELTSIGGTGAFGVAFSSTQPGQGEVLFGTGPGCSGLVEVATQDLGAGTNFHQIKVTGNDLPGTVGDNGILPGVTYFYELVTITSTGTQVDNNGGNCYSVTIPSS